MVQEDVKVEDLKGRRKKVVRREESVACDQCGKVFKKKSYLSHHIRYFHQGREEEDQAECDQCGKVFRCLRYLKYHIRRTHQERREEPVECDQCGKEFSKKSYLTYHIRYFHLGIKRKDERRQSVRSVARCSGPAISKITSATLTRGRRKKRAEGEG